jgi:hypothetical protein
VGAIAGGAWGGPPTRRTDPARLAGAVGTVVSVMDGPRLSLTGRVVLALAVLLALPSSAGSLPLGTTGAPPAPPAVRAALRPPPGILGHVFLVRTVARHCQRNRRGYLLVAVLAAALAGTVVAATRRSWVARSRDLDRRLFAFGPRAPPLRS